MGPMGRRGRRRGLIVGAALGSAAANRAKSTTQADQSQDTTSTGDQIEQLQKLAQLKNDGILTDEEFNTKKKQILEQ